MVRTVHDAFEEFNRRLTPTATQRNKERAHRQTVEKYLRAKLDVVRMFESGSFSHGTGVRGFSDVDVFVVLKRPRPESSYSALRRVQTALSSQMFLTAVKIRRPAVVVEFNRGQETWEVIPAYNTGAGKIDAYAYWIPSPRSGKGWIKSAPQVHARYVTARSKRADVDAKKFVRLVKAWKYIWSVPISSFYLEMQAARYAGANPPTVPIFDLAGFFATVRLSGLAPMKDPSGMTGLIRPCSSAATKKEALSKLASADSRARKALAAYEKGNEVQAFEYLNLLFGGRFPARNA